MPTLLLLNPRPTSTMLPARRRSRVGRPFPRGPLGRRVQQFATGLFAAAAAVGARGAVWHVWSVASAFVAAALARCDARVQHGTSHIPVVLGLTREDTAPCPNNGGGVGGELCGIDED